jgi:hypothetical protein
VTRKMALGFVIFLVICAAVYLRLRRPKALLGTAYVGGREVTLWDSSAQVRAPIATVNYGEQLSILERLGEQVEVRTARGVTGWTTDSNLLTQEFWKQEQVLQAKTAAMTVEAEGHTRVISNLHIEPGRDSPRIRQLGKDVALEFFAREPVDVPAAVTGAPTAPAAPQSDTESVAPGADASGGPKKEDWWLARARFPDQSTLSGWLLGRFVDLDVPEPLPDYASSAGMRIVAWFELNRVPDTDGQMHPQYLVVGTQGTEGQVCDFTMMRVYTWGKLRSRYETAFVQSDLCGKLPVKLTRLPGGQDVSFSFGELSDGPLTIRTYRMRQTIVRRVDLEANKRRASR